MTTERISSQRGLNIEKINEIKMSMMGNSKIGTLTHNFYKYPACFPHLFPRTVLKNFTEEDDWIFDPFSGGGTTAVECLASHRNFVGTDINELAVFSAKFKTTLLDQRDLMEINEWAHDIENFESQELRLQDSELIFFKNISSLHEKFIRRMKAGISQLSRPRSKVFATGVLLRLMQFEVERNQDVIVYRSLSERFKTLLASFLDEMFAFSFALEKGGLKFRPVTEILCRSIEEDSTIIEIAKHNREFDLVVTSPPYPQRHILYNKWQVGGRAETRIPYWIIDSEHNFSESVYTMGAREHRASLEIYLSSIHSAYSNVNQVLKKNGMVIQVVAFSDLKTQLLGFLDAMEEAGFTEVRNLDRDSYDGRMWRNVPNQKWFNRVKKEQGQCKEVILVHKKTRNT